MDPKHVSYLERWLAVLEGVITAARHADADLPAEVCRMLVERGGLQMAWVGRVDPRTQRVTPIASWGDHDGYLIALSTSVKPEPLGQGPTGRAIRERKPATCQDFEADPRMEPWREAAIARGFGSSAAVPVENDRGEVLEVVCAYSAKPGFFTPSVVRWLAAVGDAVALGRDRAQHAAMRSA